MVLFIRLWGGDMFVLQSTYNTLQAELMNYKIALNHMNCKWGALVDRINEKGGEEFLERDINPFSDDELKKMIALCHPDKHNGKESAKEITQKLSSMRS